MSLVALADHMASKGRGGDSMLVHMSPEEVHALQALAKRHGRSLTINPETGQPEAFSLKSLLPTIIGAGLSIASGGTLTPMMAAMITGAGYTAATGSLQKGLMAGLGAWGGAGLGAGLNAAAAATPISDVAAATGQPGLGFSDVAAGVPEAAGAAPTAVPTTVGEQAARAATAAPTTATAMPELVPQATVPSTAEPGMFDRFSSGLKALGTESGREAFLGQAGSKGVEATGVGGYGGLTKYGVAALAPSLLEQPRMATYAGSGPNPYNFAFNWERPSGPRYDSREAQQLYGNLRMLAEGGETTDDKNKGFLRGVDSVATPEGVWRFDGTVTPWSATNPKPVGGGFFGAPVTAPEPVVAAAPEPTRYMGMTGASADAMRYLMGEAAASPTVLAAQDYMAKRQAAAAPSATSMMPITTPETPNSSGNIFSRFAKAFTPQAGAPTFAYNPATGQLQALAVPAAQTQTDVPVDYTVQYADGGITALSAGGMSHLGSYSDGGRLLRGPGDGVSDSIPATIGQGQPARLADGEFVVPARIVSELGNGSTDAGARKLYAMMDRVQKARGKTTGKGNVAKDSRADKALPA